MKPSFKETDNQKHNPRLEEYIARYKADREKAKNIVTNDKYMRWLAKFSYTYTAFADDTWLYMPEKLSAEDLEKVNSLSFFFEGIEVYAMKNFLPIYPDECGHYVLIKFNDVGYRIGTEHGQGSYSYCSRVEITSDQVFIDFNDIMNDKKQEHVDFITQKLDDLSKLIDEMISSGVPVTNISATVASTLDKYEDQDND